MGHRQSKVGHCPICDPPGYATAQNRPKKSSKFDNSSKDRVQKDFSGFIRCGDMAILIFFAENMAEKLSANQIHRVLKTEYLKNRLSVWANFLHGDSKWWMEHDKNLYLWVWPTRGTFWACPFWARFGGSNGPKDNIAVFVLVSRYFLGGDHEFLGHFAKFSFLATF